MNQPSTSRARSLRVAGVVLASVLLSGCQTESWNWQNLSQPMVTAHTPSNVYVSAGLPGDLRRVALLPITLPKENTDAENSAVAIEQALQQEILKANRFELVIVSATQLRQWTGRAAVSAEEKLPRDFLATIKEHSGCEGVLFVRVTRFRAYPPLTVGLNLKLVYGDAPNRILWAVDEVFDAGQPGVAKAAANFARRNAIGSEHLADGWSVLHSPQRFGQYAANAVMTTLPTR